MTEEIITCDQVLKDWHTCVRYVSEMTENELRTLLNYELSTKHRETYITRIHERYSRLRTLRERQALLSGMVDHLGE